MVTATAVETLLVVLQALAVAADPMLLTVVVVLTVLSSATLLAAAAPQLLDGVRTALHQPHPLPGRSPGPTPPEPDVS